MATVLVCGATGTTGSEVLRQLQAQGVGVRALTRSEQSATDHHGGAVYSVTGPEAGSPREQIAILSELLGRELIAQEGSIEQAKASMIDGGLSDWYAERLGELLSLFAEGVAEAISPDVQRVTGRPPRGYRQFASDHLKRFGD